MAAHSEERATRLAKEGRTGPGGKPSRQKSPRLRPPASAFASADGWRSAAAAAAAYAASVEAGLSSLRLLAFAAGCCLLAWAPSLCRQAVLYYSGGALLGTLLSMALLVLLVNRLTPLRRLLGPLLLAGATCMSLAWSYLASHLAQVVRQHRTALLAYLACSACLSLAVCYWLGPVTNQRSFRIMEVALRCLALAFMLAACQLWQLSAMAAIAILLRRRVAIALAALAVAPTAGLALWPSLTGRCRPLFWRWCPRRWRPLRPRRRLTRAEFSQQGRDCTELALCQLRQHCASPDCNAWRVTSRLRDPAGFARFMQGGCHISLDSDVTSDESSDGGVRGAASPPPVANGVSLNKRQRPPTSAPPALPSAADTDSSLTD